MNIIGSHFLCVLGIFIWFFEDFIQCVLITFISPQLLSNPNPPPSPTHPTLGHTPESHGAPFVLFECSLMCGLPLEHGQLTSGYALQIASSSPSSCQSPIAPLLERDFMPHSSLHAGTSSGLALRYIPRTLKSMCEMAAPLSMKT